MSCYFFTPKPNPHAKHRLFCFPYAGGQAAIFFDWHQYLSEEVEVVTVQLPGRGGRFTDPFITDLKTVVTEICLEFCIYFDKPFSIFGHSNGALFAYEMVRQLSTSLYIKNCRNLFLSAKSAPKLKYQQEPLHTKSNKIFKKELCKLGGISEEVLTNQDILDVLLPMIKNDFKVGYEYVEQMVVTPNIQIKTTFFCGTKDKDVSKQSMYEWGDFLKGEIDFISIDGGHFFIHEQKQILIDHIKKKL